MTTPSMKSYIRATGPDAPISIGGHPTVKGEPFTCHEKNVTPQVQQEFGITEVPAKKPSKKGV